MDMAQRYAKGSVVFGSSLDDTPAKVVYLLKFIDNVISAKLKED